MAERSEAPVLRGGRGLDHAQCCLRYAPTARDPWSQINTCIQEDSRLYAVLNSGVSEDTHRKR